MSSRIIIPIPIPQPNPRYLKYNSRSQVKQNKVMLIIWYRAKSHKIQHRIAKSTNMENPRQTPRTRSTVQTIKNPGPVMLNSMVSRMPNATGRNESPLSGRQKSNHPMRRFLPYGSLARHPKPHSKYWCITLKPQMPITLPTVLSPGCEPKKWNSNVFARDHAMCSPRLSVINHLILRAVPRHRPRRDLEAKAAVDWGQGAPSSFCPVRCA
jgi:hypothetical protein